MDIQKLKSFITLAECGSFSETAELVYLSQPAISKQIESLENELQVPLFNRSRNNITLTIQGEYFRQYAEEIVRLCENSKEHLKQLENLNEGTLFFGATNFIGVYLIPELILKYQKDYPKIKINMTISSSRRLFIMLEKHEIEFAFLSHYVDLDRNKYISELFCIDHMVLIVSKDHGLAHKTHCKISDFKDDTFIMKDTHSSLSQFLEERLGSVDFNHKMMISSQEGIKQAVLHNLGFSIMSKRSVEIEVQAGLIKMLEIQDYNLDREIHIVYHRKKHITPAGRAFLELNNKSI